MGQPPLRYRTPSPPHDSIERLSPGPQHIESNAVYDKRWADDTGKTPMQDHGLQNTPNFGLSKRYGPHRVESNSVMEAFASIALATKSSQIQARAFPPDNRDKDIYFDGQNYCGRSSKRAWSEKLPSPDWRRTPSRPMTSYVQSTDDRRVEAELLLNFSNGARFDVPRKSISKQEPPPIGDHHLPPEESLPFSSVQSSLKDKCDYRQLIHMKENVDQRVPVAEGLLVSPRFAEPFTQEATATATKSPQSSAPIVNTLESRSLTRSNVGTHVDLHCDHSGTLQTDKRHPMGEIPESIELVADGTQVEEIISSPHRRLEAPNTSEVTKHHLTINPEVPPAHDVIGVNVEVELLTPQKLSAEGTIATSVQDQDIAETQVQIPTTMDAGFSTTPPESSGLKYRQPLVPSVCAACNFSRNVLTIETENDATSWISCDGCKSWFHFACAGFKSEREVRAVDKYRCRKCKPIHGSTTYVRKSARAHSAIDYAGLNEGVLKTSDENPEHHYIKPIKDGIIKFHPENFARMRPELVTADYFEKGDGMKEPILIPAALNPKPYPINAEGEDKEGNACTDGNSPHDQSILNDSLSTVVDYETVPDHGQDALDMVIPRDLTVRQVAELYGLDEKVEVIDVKSQNGEDKKWNMRRWVDYYESQGDKVVRNVISLEVSQSKLGRLIRRPKIVRDLDLQDSVWPVELHAKGDFPKVQFYCLMSVADCFTDFHIDFGGSSVFYHILKGKKTFFFIPPHEKHLKKYEEWCMSPAQNWTFLGDQTKECYRVDLSEGDTMLIPAGWIHAVWTPEDSLVIGGNFLTRMHYQMQIRVAQIEKATGVARKFRYPHFQKLLWYTALRYLEEDPFPESVSESLLTGQSFQRERPTYEDFHAWGDYSNPGPENYHARYYSKAELDGLPELGRYLQRTALIAIGNITEGINVETRNAVKRSIPKGHGEPLDVVKRFAIWYTWKRGNEPIPHWAYPDHIPEGGAPELTEKKLSAAALRRLDREAALQAYRVAPDRKSTRRKTQQPDTSIDQFNSSSVDLENQLNTDQSTPTGSGTPILESNGALKRSFGSFAQDRSTKLLSMPSKKQKNLANLGNSKPRKAACESCRKRRRACKHRDELLVHSGSSLIKNHLGLSSDGTAADMHNPETLSNTIDRTMALPESDYLTNLQKNLQQAAVPTETLEDAQDGERSALPMLDVDIPRRVLRDVALSTDENSAALQSHFQTVKHSTSRQSTIINTSETPTANSLKTTGRSKACKDCRKSKVCDSMGKNTEHSLTMPHSDVAFTMNLVTKIRSRSKRQRFLDHLLLRDGNAVERVWRTRVPKSQRKFLARKTMLYLGHRLPHLLRQFSLQLMFKYQRL